MPSNTTTDALDNALPYLRRYARALTGNQNSGDAFALDALELLVSKPELLVGFGAPKAALFHAFHLIWENADDQIAPPDTSLEVRAQKHLSKLTKGSREALLLSSIEQFPTDTVARIMSLDVNTVEDLLRTAHADVANSTKGNVLVIEDEAVTAMDIESTVSAMGHTLIGTARTHPEAVLLAKRTDPDLILSDIQLADDTSGVDAVEEILRNGRSDIPVIFITGFPERFLTGQRPEPAFLITKPYTPAQVRSAVSQAMFFASVETLA
ncbi:MAG: response regulator [Silicimonas sp.]|nr:response regulator [Silicimonas sp.]